MAPAVVPAHTPASLATFGPFDTAQGIDLDEDLNRLYVAQSSADRNGDFSMDDPALIILDAETGQEMTRVVNALQPRDVSVAPDREIALLDRHDRIRRYSTGLVQTTFDAGFPSVSPNANENLFGIGASNDRTYYAVTGINDNIGMTPEVAALTKLGGDAGVAMLAYDGPQFGDELSYVRPWDVAVSPVTGDVWVSIPAEHVVGRIYRRSYFSSTIVEFDWYGWRQSATEYAAGCSDSEYRFTTPRGIDFDAQGDLWVADEGCDQLVEIEIGGVASPDHPSGLRVGMTNPWSVGVDSGNGSVYGLRATGTTSEVERFDIGDNEPPVTSDDLPPYVTSTPQTVTLSATDEGGSGSLTTYFRIDGGQAQAYSEAAKPVLTAHGQQLEYWSVDAGNNTEAAHERALNVDITPPTTTDNVSGVHHPDGFPLELEATDNLGGSGALHTYYTLDGSTPTAAGPQYDLNAPPEITEDGTVVKYFSVDHAGNVEDVRTATAQIDRDPPDGTITAPGAWVNVASPTVTYDVDEPASESGRCFLNEVNGDTVSFVTLWTCAPSGTAVPEALVDGKVYRLDVYARDRAGNLDPTAASIVLALDLAAPDTTVSGPAGAHTTSTPLMGFASSEAGSVFSCRVLPGGDPFACASGDALPATDDGAWTLEVTATDAAGNADPTPATSEFTIDTQAPQTTASAPAGLQATKTPLMDFASSEAGSVFSCRVLPNGDPFACASGDALPATDDGAWTLEVAATDAAGNADPTPATTDFIVDSTDPVTTIDSGPTTITRDTTPTWTFDTIDASAVDHECSVHLRSQPASFADCSSPHTAASLAEGDWQFDVRATDAAGHTGDTTTAPFTLDTDGVTIVDASDVTSDANGCGTESNPCALVQTGITNAASGDSVRLRAGSHAGATVGKAVIITGSGTVSGTLVVGVGGVTIRGLHLTGSPAVSVGGAVSGTEIHRNRLGGNVSAGAGAVDAENNWWGCNEGPAGLTDCADAVGSGIDADPWLRLTADASVTTIQPGASTTLEASLATNSDGEAVASPVPPASIGFSAASGVFSPPSATTGSTDGLAGTTWTAGTESEALAATLDAETVSSSVTVTEDAGDGGAGLVDDGGSLTTDDAPGGGSVDAGDAQDATLTLPSGTSGTVVLQEQEGSGGYTIPSAHGTQPTGFAISAPDPGEGQQFTLTFLAYLPGIPASQVEIFRNGVLVDDPCPEDPCLDGVEDLGGGVFRITVLSRFASFWAVGGPDPTVVMLSGPNVTTSQYTNDNTPTFTYKTQVGGIDVPNASVTYACAIGAITNTCGAGNYTAASTVAEGSRTFGVQARVAGLAGPVENTSFVVDTAPPVPTVDSGPAQPYTASQGATFTFAPHDPSPSAGIASTLCTLDGGAPAACTSPESYSGLAEGPHSFQVTYTDAAGNSASSSPYNWRVDPTPPETTLTGTLPGRDQDGTAQDTPTFSTQSTSASFSFTTVDPLSPPGNASGVANVRCSLDGGPFVACPASYNGLGHGVHTFRVRGIDNVGNVETVGANQIWTWFVDLEAPDVAPVYPYPGGRFSYYKDVRSQYACDDQIGPPFPSESGVLTCLGEVPVGTPFDHTSQGMPVADRSPRTYSFTIDREDKIGNQSAAPFNYFVYTFKGLILEDVPKAYFRMNDPAGTTKLDDISANNHDGIYKNGTASGPIGVSGDNDTARVFTGADGYGYVNKMPTPGPEYTMAAFVQFANDENGMVMQHGRAGALFRRGDSIVFRQTSEEVELPVPGGIVPGCWYFVGGRSTGSQAMVYAGTHDGPAECTGDGSDLRWFTPQSAVSTSRPSGAGSTFYVGYGEHAQWLDGLLDEVAYFDTDIGATHVKELWLADPQPKVRAAAAPGPSSPSASGGSAPSSSGAAAQPEALVTPPTAEDAPESYSAPSANPDRTAAKARVKTLTRKLTKARRQLRKLQRTYAPLKRIAAAKKSAAKLQKQLRAARRRL